ncbi:hypothetical protein [Brevundimonas naejangsanensis]
MRSLSAFCEAWRQLGVFATRTQFTLSLKKAATAITHSRATAEAKRKGDRIAPAALSAFQQ